MGYLPAMKPTQPAPEDVPELRAALLAHYDRTARDLPWRRDRDPYRVLVSEIMLQQTRVETVVGYYEPWLERFPTVEALADADEDDVLKAWEGLGYYRRARNLHRAARMVRERARRSGGDSGADANRSAEDEGSETSPGRAEDEGGATSPGGAFPSTSEGLRELPGVGEYTAGAVASIAFEEAVPAVDGNVRRVLSRLHDEPDPKPKWLRLRAEELVDADRPGDWNQALMELGATVCTPRSPDCDWCPLTPWCAAHAAGTQEERPGRSASEEVPAIRFVLAVLERDGRVLVERRPSDGLLGGLWAFPEARIDGGAEGAGPAMADGVDAAARDVADRLGVSVVDLVGTLEPVEHRFSHLKATYVPVVLRVAPRGDEAPTPALREADRQGADDRAGADDPGGDGERGGADDEGRRPTRWIDPEGDDSTALPVAQRKVLEAWRAARGAEQTV